MTTRAASSTTNPLVSAIWHHRIGTDHHQRYNSGQIRVLPAQPVDGVLDEVIGGPRSGCRAALAVVRPVAEHTRMSESYAARTESMASDGTASPTSRINVGSPFPGPIPSPTARSTKSRRYLTDFEQRWSTAPHRQTSSTGC